MRAALALAIAMVVAVTGCSESQSTRSIVVDGTIKVPAGTPSTGTVHVTIFHAWELEGELRHPRGEIVSFETNAGDYSYTLAYPLQRGEGLLVYAWLDSDADGVHCTPSSRDELAGLAEVTHFPADRVSVDVELSQACRGPDWFYPSSR